MLNERERHTLARMEQFLRESDPEFVRQFRTPPRRAVPLPHVLLVVGLALMVLGSAAVVLPVAVIGMAVAAAALVMAFQRNGSAGFSPA